MSKKSAESRAERTAALMKEQERQEYRRKLRIIGAIMLLLAVVVGVGIWLQVGRDTTSSSTASDSEFGLAIGPADAPTEIVIYEDFLCPACGYFEGLTSERLAEAAEAGDARVEYRAFNFLQNPDFEDYSLRSTNAFRAVWVQVGDEAALEFHNALFTEQPSEAGPFPDDDWFVEKAVAAGADEDKIRPAIEDLEFRDWVDDATADASGVRSTPTVYINGDLAEFGNLDELAEQVFDAIG